MIICLLISTLIQLSGAFPDSTGLCPQCNPNEFVIKPQEEVVKSDIFNELTSEEFQDVVKFVTEELDLAVFETEGDFFSISDPRADHLVEVDAFEVNKQEALDYLDNHGPRPKKFARVARAQIDTPDVMEFKVGPLPVDENTTQIIQLFEDGTIPWYKHPFFFADFYFQTDLIASTAYYLRDIFKYQTGGFCPPFLPVLDIGLEPGLECGFVDHFYPLNHPVLNQDSRRLSRVTYHFIPFVPRTSTGLHLFPVPLTFVVDVTDPFFENWFTTDFVYCQQGPFETKEEILEKFQSGELIRCEGAKEWGTLKLPRGTPGRYNYNWSEVFPDSIEAQYGRNPEDGQPQPRTFLPDGARFSIIGQNDPTGRRIKWLNWEFHIVLKNRQGIAFFDIQHNKTRIIYEMSLQEQFVGYSGFGAQGQLMYFEGYFGLGRTSSQLKVGVDCPENALYLSVAKTETTTFTSVNAEGIICVFEEDLQGPIWRHLEPTEQTTYGARGSQLVVRYIIGLENYDYAYSIAFTQDASVHVQVAMHGYMESSFFDPRGFTWRNGNMGTRVQKFTFADLHDHISGWKVDIDVLGTNNSFITYIEQPGTYEEAVESYSEFLDNSPPKAYLDEKKGKEKYGEYFSTTQQTPSDEYECLDCLNEDQDYSSKNIPTYFENQQTKYLNMTLQETELGLKLSYDNPSLFQFINEHEINSWGNPRGMAIRYDSTIRQVLSDNHPYLQAGSWTKYNLAVAQRKEEEFEIMSARYDWYNPSQSITSLDNYLNNESIRNQDLVAWVTVGVSHIPRSEDVPLISAKTTGFRIEPWNYYEFLPAINVYEDLSKQQECVPNLQQSGEQFP